MALKIRLRQQGRTNRRFYRLVVTDTRAPRDGKYVESLGWYNPVETEDEKVLFVKPERAEHWLDLGAEPTPKVEALLCKGAPSVMQKYRERALAKRAKMQAQRRAARKRVSASK